MPDWRAIVEQHLASLPVPPARRDEICRELAAHLEDEFALLRERLPEDQAMRQALRLLDEPSILSCEIRNAEREDPMNQRARAVWFPAFGMLAMYTLLFVALVRFSDFFKGPPESIFIVWLAVLVGFGALGAFWARAMGATKLERAMVSVSPIVMGLASLMVALPFQAFKTGQSILSLLDGDHGMALLIQTSALLLGALPFLRGSRHTPVDREAAPQSH